MLQDTQILLDQVQFTFSCSMRLGRSNIYWSKVGKYSNGKVNKLYGANIPIAALGTFIPVGLVWFNGGSQLAVNDASNVAAVAQVFLNTNMAAGGGVVHVYLYQEYFLVKQT